MKKLILVAISICLLLTGCQALQDKAEETKASITEAVDKKTEEVKEDIKDGIKDTVNDAVDEAF